MIRPARSGCRWVEGNGDGGRLWVRTGCRLDIAAIAEWVGRGDRVEGSALGHGRWCQGWVREGMWRGTGTSRPSRVWRSGCRWAGGSGDGGSRCSLTRQGGVAWWGGTERVRRIAINDQDSGAGGGTVGTVIAWKTVVWGNTDRCVETDDGEPKNSFNRRPWRHYLYLPHASLP